MTEPTIDPTVAAPVEAPVEAPLETAAAPEAAHVDKARVKQLLQELENAVQFGRDFAVKAAKDELAKLGHRETATVTGPVETTEAP